ncbi:MAG: DinB family protein [Chloroflexia bacterium]
MTTQERAQKIEAYGQAYDDMVTGLAKYPREMWDYRSPVDPWTIQEIVVHITDSEANSFVRCRKFIAEPGSTVAAYDEPTWARVLKYSEQSADDAIELFRWLRGNTYKLIKDLPEATWANTVNHPENGVMTMEDWLDIYLAHPRDHVEQAGRIYEEWKSRDVIK